MSWEGITTTFDYSLSRDRIYSEVSDILDPNGRHRYTVEPITFATGTVYCSEDEAEKAVSRIQGGSRRGAAVPFWDFDGYISKSLSRLDERIKKAHDRLEKAAAERYIPTITARYVTCRTCGSSLSREHLLSRERQTRFFDHCPVCSGSLKPKGRLDHIEELRAKWEQVKAERKEEEQRLTGLLMTHPERYGRKMWYVSAYIHTG